MKAENRHMKTINGPAIGCWLEKNGWSAAYVSRKLGRYDNYINSCMKRGRMATATLSEMKHIFNAPTDEFIVNPETPAPVAAETDEDPYCRVNVEVEGRVLHMKVSVRGHEDMVVVSRVRGSNYLDFMQAYSYAAHLCYKFAEQESLA